MQILRTVKIKIDNNLTDEQKQSIVDTSVEFNNCTYDFIDICCNEKKTTGIEHHHYKEVREKHPKANADLISKAGHRAEGLVKSYNSKVKDVNSHIKKRNTCRAYKNFEPLPYKKVYEFKPKLDTAGYYATIHMISFKNEVCSLSTFNGRIKFNCPIPKWFDEKYPVRRLYSAWISCKETKGVREFSLNVTFVIDEDNPVEELPIRAESVLGVDRGIYNVVATSNGILISDKPYYAVERRYAHNVEALKQKQSSSARSRLRSMSGKRKRVIRDKNHVISKFLCSIPDTSCIVFEDLTGIRKKDEKKFTKKGKKLNRWKSNWSFKDLEDKTVYKANAKGIKVSFVNPYQTSITCSECGYVEQYKGECRRKSVFKCAHCGHTDDADLNASRNIRNKFLENIGLILASTPKSDDSLRVPVSHPRCSGC